MLDKIKFKKVSKEELERRKREQPHALFCDEEPLTIQSAKDECDINLIIARAQRGEAYSINSRVMEWGDFSNVPDYREAHDLVIRAQGMFMELDANIRERFDNDPAKMLDFLANEKNFDESVKLGLRKPKAPPPAAPGPEPATAGGPTPGGSNAPK